MRGSGFLVVGAEVVVVASMLSSAGVGLARLGLGASKATRANWKVDVSLCSPLGRY